MQLSFTHPSVLWALLVFLPLLTLPLLGRRVQPMRGGWSAVRGLGASLPRQRWAAVLLRALVGLGLILGLSGAQLVRPVDDLTVVFVLDLSDSIPAAEQVRAEQFIRDAVAGMPTGARAAIVAFGEDALVERLASEAHELPPIASVPRSGRTDIGAALRLGLALFPEESQKRLVLLSDGLQNVGDARRQADLAALRGVELSVVPLLAPPVEQEAYLADLEVPATVRQGQTFAVTAVIESTMAQEATLRLLSDGQLLASRSVALEPGSNRVELALTAEATGFHRYRAELTPALDTLPQNNLASGFATVYGPPRVLLAEGTPGETDALRAALESTGVEVTVLPPAQLPTDPATLSSYDAVVLADVPAEALPAETMAALPVLVRDLGRGLVMIGGEQGYGAGGYLRTPLEAALPVDMDVRSRTQEPNIAIVFAVDKSGSMGRCHCDNPSALPGQYARVETGLPKVDIAKDAILQATQALGRLDYLGIVAFNENALWALRLQQLADAPAIQAAIGSIQAEGQTNLFAGLSEAEQALVNADARVRHIILLTDGWSRSGQYDELTRRLAEEGITLSVVAAGEGSAEYLKGLAEQGGGRYYAAPSMQDVPQIFLKETIQAVGQYLIEEPFYPLAAAPTAILRGLDPTTLPALLGYNGTTPKATAQVPLVSPRGDPVLAQWQYGLGRAVAWTSDLTGRWATDWVTWQRFNAFAAQLVGWTLPEPADEHLQAAVTQDGADVHLQVTATDAQGNPRDLLQTEATLVGPELLTQTVRLEQTAAGRYEGSTVVAEPGTYLVQIVQRDASGAPVAQRTTGLVVPYSPEYRRTGGGETLLAELAQATGGAALVTPAAAFTPTAVPAQRAQPLWPALLLLAALLFPADVAARRLRLTRADWVRLVQWFRRHGGPAAQRRQEPAVLGELFAARERARQRGARPPVPAPGRPGKEDLGEKRTAVQGGREAEKPPATPPPAEGEQETLARLREARERARRRR